jgi:small subunit ribosomal protein S3
MTHIVHPYIFRIGQLRAWKSRWFNRKKFQTYLREDVLLREWLEKHLRQSHVDTVEIERSPNTMHVLVKTSRPGILIGRGGEGAEKLKDAIKKKLFKINKQFKQVSDTRDVRLTIEEVRAPETHAAIAAQMIVDDIEKRTAFRRVMKQALEKVIAAKGVEGVKLALKGRLGGAEMARYEWAKKGRIPLQTIRADIDYAEKTAYTAYGTVGVKVWIYKGDIFADKSVK